MTTSPYKSVERFRGIRGSLKERLLLQSMPVTESGCWLWLGHTTKDGYGRIGKGGGGCKLVAAHRASYESFVGPIPKGLQIHHKCYVKSCINPAHLQPLTASDNVLDAVRTGFCKRGHEMSGDNRFEFQKNGRTMQFCRTCRSLSWPRQSARRRLERAVKRWLDRDN